MNTYMKCTYKMSADLIADKIRQVHGMSGLMSGLQYTLMSGTQPVVNCDNW